MEIHHLRTFREVVRARSFTAAGKRLFLAQPTVSQQVKALETEVGERLLERTGKDVTVDRFVAALEQTKDYQDVFGSPKQSLGPSKRLSMDESLLVQVKNGRWVRGSATLKH